MVLRWNREVRRCTHSAMPQRFTRRGSKTARRVSGGSGRCGGIGCGPRRDRERLGPSLAAPTGVLLEGVSNLSHGKACPSSGSWSTGARASRGGTVALSLYDSAGRPVSYWDVEEAARHERHRHSRGCSATGGVQRRRLRFRTRAFARASTPLGDGFTIHSLAACLDDQYVGAIRVVDGVGDHPRRQRTAPVISGAIRPGEVGRLAVVRTLKSPDPAALPRQTMRDEYCTPPHAGRFMRTSRALVLGRVSLAFGCSGGDDLRRSPQSRFFQQQPPSKSD